MQTKDEEQRLRATAVFTGVYLQIIMLEISPTEPGRDDMCESGMGNTVRNVLYSGLTPA